MNIIWKGGALRGGMAQWLFFAVVAAVIGLVVFILAALGLVVGALLVGIISASVALASRRRASGVSLYGVRTSSDRCEPEGDCVELGRDAYTIRIVDETKPPA